MIRNAYEDVPTIQPSLHLPGLQIDAASLPILYFDLKGSCGRVDRDISASAHVIALAILP